VAAPSFTTTLSPTRSDSDVGPITLGNYPNPTLAVVQVSGLIDQYYSNSNGWILPPPNGDLRGTLKGQQDAAGQFNGTAYQCYANVAVLFSQGGGKVFCDYSNMKPLTSVWADTSVLRGDGSARWYKGPLEWLTHCNGTGKPPCYTFTGSFEVSVTPAAAELTFSASRYVVYPGKGSVTFTAGRTPSQFGRFSVPFTIQSWTWTPDGGSAITPCVSTTNPCTYSPASSGTMQIAALVNGVVLTASVHVRKLCAATGDSLADSLPILDAMHAALDSAGENDVAQNRRERTWHVDCLNTGCVPLVDPLDPAAEPCRTPMHRDTSGVRKAEGPVEPFIPAFGGYSPPTELVPTNCTKAKPGNGVGIGPSPEDLLRDQSDMFYWPHLPPQYVADKRYFTRWTPDTLIGPMKQDAKRNLKSRGTGTCARF
jgi:hypothetical protein